MSDKTSWPLKVERVQPTFHLLPGDDLVMPDELRNWMRSVEATLARMQSEINAIKRGAVRP